MKVFDKVKLLRDKEEYLADNVHAGEIGTIWEPEIRDNSFMVMFDNHDIYDWYKYAIIKIEDLELVEENHEFDTSDEALLNGLPSRDKRWWCKVEDGFILNLLGERKNKIPYDYNS